MCRRFRGSSGSPRTPNDRPPSLVDPASFSSRSSSSEYLRVTPAHGFSPQHYLPGFCPLIATSPERVHSLGESSQPLTSRSVLRFSQPLDGFLRILACGLVPSCCRVQGLRTEPRSRRILSPRPSALTPSAGLLDPLHAGCRGTRRHRFLHDRCLGRSRRSSPDDPTERRTGFAPRCGLDQCHSGERWTGPMPRRGKSTRPQRRRPDIRLARRLRVTPTERAGCGTRTDETQRAR